MTPRSQTTSSASRDRGPPPWRILRANVHRAVFIALVVGSVLVGINHGDHLAQMPGCAHCFLKCGLSYLVPFVVSMVSALLAARGRREERRTKP